MELEAKAENFQGVAETVEIVDHEPESLGYPSSVSIVTSKPWIACNIR